MSTERHEQVRIRAYQIWEREGRTHGEDARHWQQAESEIAAEGSPVARKPRKAAATADKAAAAAPKAARKKPAKA